MFKYLHLAFGGALLAVAVPAPAQTTFFGENQTPNQTASGQPVTARNSFLATLSGVSTESFESYAQGTSPQTLAFNGSAGSIMATFAANGGQVCASNGCGGSGRFATDGTHYFDVSTPDFTITFNTAVAAFGFYGTDIGDVGGALTITLLRASGNTVINVPNTVNGNDGSLLFFGVLDTANPFTGVVFGNSNPGSDFFGFDQLTIGDARQVTNPPAVPEPAAWTMMIAGFGLVGAALRRRTRATVHFA